MIDATEVAFRIADWPSPLRVNGNRSAGRFNRPGQVTQYLSLHPLGPWAEFIRRERPSVDLLTQFRHRIWAHRIDMSSALTIDFGDATKYGLKEYDLVSDDYAACQTLADDLRAKGNDVIIVPSAALPGTWNVVILGERVASPYLSDPIDIVDVPSSLVADDATIPASVADLVRHYGSRHHAGLDAFRRRDKLSFVEPALRS